MIVTSIRIGATLKGDDGSFRKTEIEASPSEGQTAEDLLAEIKVMVQSNGNGKKESAPPIAGKETAKPAKKTENPSNGSSPASDSPQNTTDTPPAEPKKRGRKPKTETAAPDVGALLTSTLEAETLEDLLHRFNRLSDAVPEEFDAAKWTNTLDRLSNRQKDLRTLESDQKTVDGITAAFKRERMRVATRVRDLAVRETEAVA